MEQQRKTRAQSAEADQMISFAIGEEHYGVDIQEVKEVIRIREITQLPKAPTFVKGVINLRGDVIPIIDLREKFGLEQLDYTEVTRVIVVEVDGKSIGMVVDSVSNVIKIPQDEIEPPPQLVGELSGEYLRGIGKLGEKLIVLISIDKILTTDEKIELKKIELGKMEEVKEPAGVK